MELIDALNRMAMSVAMQALVLEIWWETYPILPFLNIHPQTPSSTVRTSFKRVDRPI